MLAYTTALAQRFAVSEFLLVCVVLCAQRSLWIWLLPFDSDRQQNRSNTLHRGHRHWLAVLTSRLLYVVRSLKFQLRTIAYKRGRWQRQQRNTAMPRWRPISITHRATWCVWCVWYDFTILWVSLLHWHASNQKGVPRRRFHRRQA